MRPFGFQKWSLTRVLRNQKCRADETLSVRFAKLGLALAAGAEPALSRPVPWSWGGLLPAEPQSTELVPGLPALGSSRPETGRGCGGERGFANREKVLARVSAGCQVRRQLAAELGELSAERERGPRGAAGCCAPAPAGARTAAATRLQTGAGRREPGMTEPAQAPPHGTQLGPGKAGASQTHVSSTNKRGLVVGAFRPGLATSALLEQSSSGLEEPEICPVCSRAGYVLCHALLARKSGGERTAQG